MPEPNEEAKDTEPDGVVPKPLTASRLAALCVAGLVGGVVGAVGSGWVVAQIAVAFTRGMAEWGGMLFFILGAVLGLPIGIATGLHIAGRKLGIRGRFWPAIGASFAVALAWIGLLELQTYLTMLHPHMGRALGTSSPFLIYAALFVLSLVGGLVGYLAGRPKRPADIAGDS